MITDTSAIVLKSINFRESSLIVTMLSQEHGKIAVIARGARRKKNKFGGLLQPGALLDVTYYFKTTRDVQNLSEVTQKKPTWHIHEQMEKMAIGLVTLELCDQLCHEYEPMPEVFEFLARFLEWLHNTSDNPKNLLPYIQYRLAELTGIGISWDVPETTSETTEPSYLNVTSGRISGIAEDGLSFPVTKLQMEYLRCIVNGKKSTLLSGSFPGQEIKQLIHHMDAYFQYHMEGMKARKADAIFEQIL